MRKAMWTAILSWVIGVTPAFAVGESVSYLVRAPIVKKFQKSFPGIKVKPMFSSEEASALRSLGKRKTANTVMIGPISEIDAKDFEEKFTLSFPKVKLEKNSKVDLHAMDPKTGDPLLREQWALKNTGNPVRVDLDDLRTQELAVKVGEDLNLPSVEVLKKMKPVTVAVLDTGVDVTHPDLRESLRWKKEECEALTTYLSCLNTPAKTGEKAPTEESCLVQVGNFDRDGNGYPMDCVGWSVVSTLSVDEKSPLNKVLGNPDMDDELGHGTHVAGIIGAKQNNGIGVSGVAPQVRILPVRVVETPPTSPLRPQSLNVELPGTTDPDPSEKQLKWAKSSVELIARGMLYAIRERVDIINLSLGWPSTINSEVIADMIALAQERGIAVVAAAGNDSTDALVLPCSYPGVICIGSYGPDGVRAPYSNRGPGVDFLAPGTSILSTYPLSLRARFFTDLQGYEFLTGTSMAAPMASGALALLKGLGFSLNESLARILIGARVGDAAPVGENLRLDLSRSLEVKPRPYLKAVERAPIRLVWKNKDEVLKGEFHLQNLWKNAFSCQIHYRLKSSLNTVSTETLLKNVGVADGSQDCGSLRYEEKKTFSFPIRVTGSRASRDFILEAEVSYASESGERFTQIIPLAVQIVPTSDLLSRTLARDETAIIGWQAGKGTMVRTLMAVDQKSTLDRPEYVVMSRLPETIGFQILSTRKSPQYQYSKVQKIKDLTWVFLAAQRYYSYEAGDTRIAFISRKTSEISGLTQIRFEIFDANLENLIRTVDYDGSFAPLPENFRWTTIRGKDAMIFLANGKEPPSSDEWHQIPDLTTVSLRCYVLDFEGKLSQVEVDKNDLEMRIVDFVPLHDQDTDKKETALLVIKGRDYQLQYFIGHYRDGKVVRLQPFEISPYRNMGFLSSSPLISEAGPASGSVLSSIVGRGRMRSTVLIRNGYDAIANGDFRFSPMNPADGLNRVAGGFQLGNRNAFFVQGTWDLEYHEFANGEERMAKTSMNRFSFLPSFVSQRAFFPILVKDENQRPEAALLTADIGSGFFNLSALVPERNERGEVVGLLRPALLSFEGSESGCSFVGNPFWDRAQKVYRMNSFCGDSVRSLVLQLP